LGVFDAVGDFFYDRLFQFYFCHEMVHLLIDFVYRRSVEKKMHCCKEQQGIQIFFKNVLSSVGVLILMLSSTYCLRQLPELLYHILFSMVKPFLDKFSVRFFLRAAAALLGLWNTGHCLTLCAALLNPLPMLWKMRLNLMSSFL